MSLYKKSYIYSSKFAIWNCLVRCHLAFRNITIPEQQTKCLVVFCIYGINPKTYDFIVNNNIVPNKNIINNFKTSLKSKGLINKIRSKKWEVCDSLKLPITNTLSITVNLELNDNSK
jgi:hypothetical protein